MSNMNNARLEYEYTVCAVVFGTDSSIVNLSLKDGFAFVRRSLNPRIDHLDTVFDMTIMGLRRNYEEARLDTDTLDVICVEKHMRTHLVRDNASEWYEKQVDQDIFLLDNQIRSIRLVCECPLRCNLVSFAMISKSTEYGEVHHSSIIPIPESIGTKEITKFHCDPDSVFAIHEQMANVYFPINNDIINIAHRYYDLSYHQDNYVSLILLIAAMEMIFISEDGAKKERLSKRCSVFLYDTQEECLDCYNKLRAAYEQRCKFVHDGVFVGVEDETILFLRNCVREVLMTFVRRPFEKSAFISSLKNKVITANCWG